MNEIATTARVLGTTEDYLGCDCCGRKNLKIYVVIEHSDGEIRHYGTSCAATMLKADASEIRKAAKAADRERRAAEVKAQLDAMSAETDAWLAWLDENAGPEGTFQDKVARLGGMAAARAAYRAEVCV